MVLLIIGKNLQKYLKGYNEAIDRADKALYISKNKGKNRVTVFDKLAYNDMENN